MVNQLFLAGVIVLGLSACTVSAQSDVQKGAGLDKATHANAPHASEATMTPEVIAAVAEVHPQSVIEAYRELPGTGLLEVFVSTPSEGDRIVYIARDGRTVIAGEAFDVTAGVSLTGAAINARRLGLLQSEAKDGATSFASPSEKATVFVFTDAACDGCKELHADIQKLNQAGVSVQYLAFPSSGLEGQAYEQLKSVWCSADRASALTQSLGGIEMEPVAGCEQLVRQQFQLGLRLGVAGVPTIYTHGGMRFQGYPGADRLLAVLRINQLGGDAPASEVN